MYLQVRQEFKFGGPIRADKQTRPVSGGKKVGQVSNPPYTLICYRIMDIKTAMRPQGSSATFGYQVDSIMAPGLIGSLHIRLPMAWETALPTAARGGTIGTSPTPRTP